MEKKVVIGNYGGSMFEEVYIKSENIKCPNCGDDEIWYHEDSDDYYVGYDYVCTGCSASFNVPRIEILTDEPLKSIIQQLIND